MTHTTPESLIRAFIEHLGITIEAIEPLSVAAHQMFNVRTPDSKQLIGPGGEHLRALNYLLRRLAERIPELSDTKFLVDVNGYQYVRIHDLEQKAHLLAERVRTFRSSAEMSPMNAYERMIIHALFANDPDITTESDGFGPTRHVVLRCRTNAPM